MSGSMLTLADGLKDLFVKYNFREPGSSEFAANSDNIFYLIFILSTIFFVILMVLMVYFAFKYRRIPGRTPQRSAQHNTFLELSWSVIPTILLVWMFFVGFWGYADQLVAPGDAPELVVQAQKWNWTLTYPNGAVSAVSTRSRSMPGDPEQIGPGKLQAAQETPIFVVPEDQPVRLRMASIDVIHSFWVPDFRAKFDVFPNRYTSTWFKPSKIKGSLTLPNDKDWGKWAGARYEDHWVFCAEYCGASHSDMYAVLRVVPADVYPSILADWATPKGSPAEKGAKYYKIKGCYSCHSVNGTRIVGPTWKDMFGHKVAFADGSSYTDEQMTDPTFFANYVRESILTPSAKIVQGYPNQMTFQKVTNEEINDIIAYIESLSDKKPPAQPAPEGEAKPGDAKPAETKPAEPVKK